jgi:ABC-type dipeptide/oligopeptide/nickel transport system permease subunit
VSALADARLAALPGVARRAEAWRRARQAGWSGMVGAVIVLAFAVLAVFHTWIEPHSPNAIGLGVPYARPSAQFWFGLNSLGQDEFSRVVDASWVALAVGVGSTLISGVLGTAFGVLAADVGGIVDTLVMRLMDVLFSFPALLLAIIVVGALGPSVPDATYAIGIVYVPRFATIARAAALSVQTRQYVEAARLAGAGRARIVLEHVLPNISAPLIVLTAVSMSTAELTYAGLSFVGLGARPPQADWGSMLAADSRLMLADPWLVIFPALALVLFVTGLNLFGDAVRDWLDPKYEGPVA